MNRREFLGMIGAAAAVSSAPSIVRSQTVGVGGAAPSGRLNVGFVGLGGISGGHVEHVLNDPNLQLVSICDLDKEHLERARQHICERYAERNGTATYNGVSTHSDFLEVVNDPNIDVVFNCTPDHWHALVLINAARAGKHLYSEKPLSRTPAEGVAMVNAVQRAGVVCQIGSQQRSQPDFQRAIILARMGALGTIKRVQVGLPSGGGVGYDVPNLPQAIPASLDYERWVGPSPFIPYISERNHFHWRWRYEFAGGQLTDWINHHFDIAQLALGVSDEMPVVIKNITSSFHTNPIYNTAAQYAFTVHYAGGQAIEVSSSNRMGMRIEGDAGWLHVDRGYTDFSSQDLRSAILPAQAFNLGGGTSDHRKNFFDCIQNGTRTRSPIDQAHKTAMVAHLANAAIRSGASEIRWNSLQNRAEASRETLAFLACNYRGPWHLPA